MRRADLADADCGIAQALGVLGDWWTFLIVRDVAGGTTRFDALQRELRVSRRALTERLAALVEHGVLRREAYSHHPPRYDYLLTPKGEGLLPVLVALQDWGSRHVMGDGALTATALADSAEARRVRHLVPEGCFALEDVEVAAGPLVRLMREFRPHVVTTYDEEGGYPHPDHIMTHKVSVAAFEAAGDPERYPELGEPWQPLKLYYDIGFSKGKIMALHEGMLAAGLASPYEEWLKRWDDRPDKGPRITTRVECADYFPVRDDALRAHATQIDPDGFWFHVPMELQRHAWPTEDFQLVRSLVDSPLPESDLFAGVRETAHAR
ncbi:mycothiol conjugate amidase Mca [Micromonospora purpureochromogenes]|uniref:mycothiol conjugate amidase Mca n=1 Tax=Micromonospora purpureochromogenes TaxID=47872 RepID=UPI003328827F